MANCICQKSGLTKTTKRYAQQVGVPEARKFQTKPELFWQMLQRAQAEELPFVAVAVDGLYGRSFWLRQHMDQAGIEFYADVPANTQVYLSEPQIGIAQHKRGPKATEPSVLSPQPHRIEHLPVHPAVLWQSLTLRPTERGWLKADFARIPVWTVQDDMTVTKQWLLMRKEGKKHSYTFSNASARHNSQSHGVAEIPTLLHRARQSGRQIRVRMG